MEHLQFHEAVKMARVEKGLTKAQLARIVDVDASYIGKIESGTLGNRGPSIQLILRLSEALGLDGKALLRLAGRDRDALLGMLLRRVKELESQIEEMKREGDGAA